MRDMVMWFHTVKTIVYFCFDLICIPNRLTMKKEIHTRTMMKDGKEQTFVHEEAQIEQEEDPPEELKDSMQQIIDQFMETPAQPEQYKALEHDV